MLYHASRTAGIKFLEPKISNHNVPLIYLSNKRENVLVYLSNAIEKHCKQTGFQHSGKWHKWASYGFDSDGILRLDEFYPNGLEDTYKGVSGYIYYVDTTVENEEDVNISDVVATSRVVPVSDFEFVEDVYAEIIKAAELGLIRIRKYEDMDDKMLDWIKNTIQNEYVKSINEPDYRYFLESKFSFLNR